VLYTPLVEVPSLFVDRGKVPWVGFAHEDVLTHSRGSDLSLERAFGHGEKGEIFLEHVIVSRASASVRASLRLIASGVDQNTNQIR
jgi:hypothetical protein